MKRLLYILIMCLAVLTVQAQSLNRWSIRVGEFRSYDQILSQQEYNGVSITLNALHLGQYRDTGNVYWYFRDQFRFSPMLNSSRSARLYFGSIRLDYGTNYAFDLGNGFRLSAGGYLDIYGGIKYNTRNVNNIASADVQIGLRAAATAHYMYRWSSKFALGCHYGLSTPLIGCFFAPDYGESYYEIWLNLPSSLNHSVHFSSFHNRQGIMGDLAIDLIFPHGVLTLGFNHENEWWQTSTNSFYESDISGSIGFALRLASLKPY